MFANILIMWETPTGERKWETINSRQYKGFLEKLLREGVNPASVIMEYNPAFFHWVFPSEHGGFSDVDFFHINETIGGCRESAHEPPYIRVEEETPRAKYGWIAPDGRYFMCSYGGHTDLATKIVGEIESVYDPEAKLEKLGWAKVCRGISNQSLYGILMGKGKKLTDAQLATLRRHGLDTVFGIELYL